MSGIMEGLFTSLLRSTRSDLVVAGMLSAQSNLVQGYPVFIVTLTGNVRN